MSRAVLTLPRAARRPRPLAARLADSPALSYGVVARHGQWTVLSRCPAHGAVVSRD